MNDPDFMRAKIIKVGEVCYIRGLKEKLNELDVSGGEYLKSWF